MILWAFFFPFFFFFSPLSSQLLRWPGHGKRVIFQVQCLGLDSWGKSLPYTVMWKASGSTVQRHPNNPRCKLVAAGMCVWLGGGSSRPELIPAGLPGGVPCRPITEAGTRMASSQQPLPTPGAPPASQRLQPLPSHPTRPRRQLWAPHASSTTPALSPHCPVLPAQGLAAGPWPCAWAAELREGPSLRAPCFWGSPVNPSCPLGRLGWEAPRLHLGCVSIQKVEFSFLVLLRKGGP